MGLERREILSLVFPAAIGAGLITSRARAHSVYPPPQSQDEGLKIVNVKDYGAIGDGVTDDSQSIQNAIDSLGSGTGTDSHAGVILFPHGRYLCISSISVSDSDHISFIGNGSRYINDFKHASSYLVYGGSGSSPFVSVGGQSSGNYSRGFSIKSMGLGYTSSSFTGPLVDIGTSACHFEDVSFSGASISPRLYSATGVKLNGSSNISFVRCMFDELSFGLFADGTCNGVSLSNCVFSTFSDTGLFYSSGGSQSLDIERCSFNPVRQIPGTGSSPRGGYIYSNGYSMRGCMFAGNTSSNMYSEYSVHLVGRGEFSGNSIFSDSPGLFVSGGVHHVSGNYIVSDIPVTLVGGDCVISGGSNEYRPISSSALSAVAVGVHPMSGGLMLNIGPDRIKNVGSSRFLNSYKVVPGKYSQIKGEIIHLPSADGSTLGPSSEPGVIVREIGD